MDISLNCKKQQITDIKNEIQKSLLNFYNVLLLEQNRNKIIFEISSKNENIKLKLSQMFRNLENLKLKFPIQSYALNQTTLEQIIIRMAKEHNSNWSRQQE